MTTVIKFPLNDIMMTNKVIRLTKKIFDKLSIMLNLHECHLVEINRMSSKCSNSFDTQTDKKQNILLST